MVHTQTFDAPGPGPKAAAPFPSLSPRRVLLVVESSGGGTGRHVLDLAEGLAMEGCDVHLLYSPSRMDALFAHRLARLRGVHHTPIPMSRSIHPGDLKAALAIRRYLYAHGPFDVIHGHSSKGGALARLAAAGTGCPVVYTPHGLIVTEPHLSPLKRLAYWAIEVGLSLWTSRIIAVSPEEQRAVIAAGLGRERATLVPNGIAPAATVGSANARRSIGVPPTAFVVGFVGRLVAVKAVDVLLDAFAIVCRHAPDARLAIIGSGPLEAALRQRASLLGVAERVLWLGERDASAIYAAFDVFALSSRKEGLPYVVLEAMAAGLPVVATDSAGVQILVENGVNGKVVPRDDVRALADVVVELACNPAQAATYGQASRQRVSRFTVEAMVQGVLRQYAQVAPSRRAAPMEVQTVRGDEAYRLLDSLPFLSQWDALHGQCPWATAFQTHGYARAWYSTYAGQFAPLLLVARSADGTLRGLLTLAVAASDGTVVVAGRQQAEYHAWICPPALGDRFPLWAMRALRREIPGAALTFHYLAPNTPTAWLAAPGARRLCLLKSHRRPLLTFGDGSEIVESLKKSSNKSRLKRMEKLGGLEFRRVTDPAEFEGLFDDIVRLYDLRHGAVQGSDPFCTLDRQKAFHLAMMKVPGLLHVTVMRVGGRLAAAHFGAAGRKELQLGTIVHDPSLSRHSPGKFQVLLLSRMLIEEGYEQFDLTPGGDPYKERFTNASGEVHTLAVLPTPGAQARMRATWRGKHLAKVALRRFGVTATQARFLLSRLRRPSRLATLLLRRGRTWAAGREVTRIYARDARLSLPAQPSTRVRRDCLDDLLAYDPGAEGQSRQAFLGDALTRLEGGQHVYTVTQSGRLRRCAWVDEQPGGRDWRGALPGFTLPAHAAMISGVRDFGGSDVAGAAELIAAVVHDLAQAPGSRQVLLTAAAEWAGICTAAEQVGFRPVDSLVRVTRFGKHRWQAADKQARGRVDCGPPPLAAPAGTELRLRTTPAV